MLHQLLSDLPMRVLARCRTAQWMVPGIQLRYHSASAEVVSQDLATRLAHAGCVVDSETGALTPPIHPSSTFEREKDLGYPKGFVYSRASNPTRELLERVLADIETPLGRIPGEACSFAAGVAAAAAVFQSLPGGHVILADDIYHGNRSLLMQIFQDWGLKYTMVDMTDLDAVKVALDAARAINPNNTILWAETPSNPLLKVTDIRAIADICAKEVPLVVDATWCTPWLCQPLGYGADIVVHSSTKYFGGHSDLTGGALITSSNSDDGACPAARELFERCRVSQSACGGVPSAFDAWLTLRGLRSLPVRMERHCQNGMAVAKFLERHPRVTQVYYPGLDSHPGRETMLMQGRDQMEAAMSKTATSSSPRKSGDLNLNLNLNCFGGMVSFQVQGGKEAAVKVASSMKIFKRATSLGGTESLVEHRRSVEDDASVTPENLLRLSVGLESEEDLLNDLESALKE